jgi:hypothetical protein
LSGSKTKAPGSAGGYLLYTCTLFALPHVKEGAYCCEVSSVAAAVSNIRYGAPFGTVYSGVQDYFVQRLWDPLEQTLQRLQTSELGLPVAPPGELWKTTRDGNGVGYPVIATVAFRLFGLHAWALTVTMLLLMALSTAALLWRFPGVPSACIVILYFSALTFMLFTTML